MAISEKDIPRIHQIIDIALRHGSSVWEIVNKLEDALEGAYSPRGYDANDLNIATLIFRLVLGVPSLHTLCSKSTFTSIFDQNIRNVVLTTCTHSSLDSLRGEMAVHFSKYNKVGGLCWKHSHTVEPVLRTYNSAVHIAQKIHAGELHLGKELTVIDEIYPILAAPTCKNEDASDMEHILARAIGSWNRTGVSKSVSPIWCAAGHKLFVKFPLPPESPLYGTLVNLQGLNLFTGEGEIMLDFDFKHVFKCECFLPL
ncbi:hypothetical protein DFH29DRAFT_982714 [Suillus ampliporus]|nr:hypothetical protein DFH29DRAFT_982714 [Suillus ampliporus]